MKQTSWVITKDWLADEFSRPGSENAVGISGPEGCPLNARGIASSPEVKRFRLYDDDNGLTYSGLMVVGDEIDAELMPLDNYGRPNAGCTIMRVLNVVTGEWEVL